MHDGRLPDGSPQSLYQWNTKDQVIEFKGMAQILIECGFTNAKSLQAECKDFKCTNPDDPNTQCCCHRILFNQPDFKEQKSALEEFINSRGHFVIFYPKFHCELNFIEQCWGYAKRVYRLNPTSSKEEHLLNNTINAIEAVPLVSIRR